MLQSVKELIVILGMTLPIWIFGRHVLGAGLPAGVFSRRRNLWLIVTVAAVLSPNIWLYLLIAGPSIVATARKDPNPLALFILLLFAVPGAAINIPPIGFGEFIAVSHPRLLACVLLLPLVTAARGGTGQGQKRGLDAMDFSILAFMALIILLPQDSVTHTLRRSLLFVFDTLLVYYAFSRLRDDSSSLPDCMRTWVLSGCLLAAVALFENFRSWLLYAGISERWGDPNVFSFLLRGGSLRAQAAAGHSLTLGIWLALAWVFYLYASRTWNSRNARWAAGALLLGGLWSCLARGAWLAAVIGTVIFLLLDPKGLGKGVRGVLGLVGVMTAILISPWGEKVIDYLPFVGTVDSFNVSYRQMLFDRSLELIAINPIFGNSRALDYLEDMRQGQGIIDIVNGYLFIALFYGLSTLSAFIVLMLAALGRVFAVWRRSRQHAPEVALMAAALLAALMAEMVFIATASIDPFTYLLAGLACSLWWLYGSKGTVEPSQQGVTVVTRSRQMRS